MSDKRATLDFNLESEIQDVVSIEELATAKPIQKESNFDALKKVSEQSGFISREAKMRRVKPTSPYMVQLNLKTQKGVKEIFQEIGARLGVFDQTTFEYAISALLEKEKMFDLIREMEEITR